MLKICQLCQITKFTIELNRKQIAIPVKVGKAKARAVHLKLLVSLAMVMSVVEQGQCIIKKSIVETAVVMVQPLLIKRLCNSDKELYSTRLPLDIYAIIIIGMTISFAGKPRIKAIKITPSRPSSEAKGSRKLEQMKSNVSPLTVTLAINQITRPAGAATVMALPSTKRVLSKIERIITLVI